MPSSLPFRVIASIALLGAVWANGYALERITIGVHGYDSAERFSADWQPLAEDLTQMMPGYDVAIVRLDHASLAQSLQHHRLDFLLADPAIYVQIRESNSMAQSIATVVGDNGGEAVVSSAGAIVTRGDRADLVTLEDLRGKRIAYDDKGHLTSYQAQAHAFYEADMVLEGIAELQSVKDDSGFHKLEMLQRGEVDAVFQRAGLLENLAIKGQLRLEDYKLVNKQLLPGYPYAASTRLYAERVVVALPHVDPDTSQRLVTALYSLENGSVHLRRVGIHSFTLPADYSAVVTVARDLKIPPFDTVPAISIVDLWRQYRRWIMLILITATVVVVMAILLIIINRRLHTAKASLEHSNALLAESKTLLQESLNTVKESNDRFDLVMLAANDGVWDWDFATGHVYYSPRWLSMLGYEEGELDAHLSSWGRLVDAHDGEHVMTLVQECIEGKRDGFVTEFRMRHKDGSWRDILSRGIAVRNAEGTVVRFAGTHMDITERKQTELERARLSRELLQAQKMESLGQLTGGIAHDFNNLLGIINGYSGLALANCENRGEEKLAGYMRQLIAAGERAASLVAQMLAFSRIDQSEDKPIHFAPLIKEDVKMLRATLPTTIEIKCDVEEDLPPVLMNPTQLHQILMNLSINARDAMGGEGRLDIRLGWARNLDTESPVSHKPVKGDWLELSVRDSGSGIAPELIAKIFNPFFTTKEVGKGTGLGLSVVYSIMEAHNGHILVESKPGEGTCFRMLFMPHLLHVQPGQGSGTAAAELPQGDGSEILVVDDEESIALFISELVNLHGYKATTLSSSEEALALFGSAPARFSMVITDQTMPRLTGAELIKRLRAFRPGLPAILCTGYSDKIDAAGAGAMSVSFFRKPVELEALLREIARVLRPATAEREHDGSAAVSQPFLEER